MFVVHSLRVQMGILSDHINNFHYYFTSSFLVRPTKTLLVKFIINIVVEEYNYLKWTMLDNINLTSQINMILILVLVVIMEKHSCFQNIVYNH